MADILYTVNQELPENILGFEQYSQEDRNLVNSFQINSTFNPTVNYSELHILSLSDELLESTYNYTGYTQLGNAQSAGQLGASVLTVDPVADSIAYGYENGGVKLLYHFLDDLYTTTEKTVEFYIQDISQDRTELSLSTLHLTLEEVNATTSTIKSKLQNQSYFTGFRLNFKNNDLFIATNIDTLEIDGERVVVVKLYEPLPATYGIKSTLNLVDIVSDSVVYEIDSEIVIVPKTAPTLRSANFNIEIADNSVIPTEYYNYNELFSYPINNANSQIFSTVNEKGIEISTDYTAFSNFIHFSSAQERLLNFKYKLDLIQNYSSSIALIANTTTGLQGISGSRAYYENLMTGVVSNFDHYERHLYYESGSSSWPKSNTTKPYNNKASDTIEATQWYTDEIAKAVYYDQTNYNSLVYSVPTYLRDDANNENYITFVYMVGQHFDNLWLYSKAVTDKYDADNRIDHGISKDLVAEALKNFGVKLYTSNKSVEDLFTTFIGQAYQSGSEEINTYITGSLTGSNTPIQPTSYDNYQKEVQKRIYHNLPLLLKSKGTERGIRALITCLGIPPDTLKIKLYGGRNIEEKPSFGDYIYYTSSLGKIRVDNTGSIVEGNTLSQYTSINKRDKKYTDDIHPIEIGFSPTDNIDTYIISKSSSDFNIDEYLGDPRNLYQDSYYQLNYTGSIVNTLSNLTDHIMSGSEAYNVQDYVRLIKFFDNTVFKMVKDFVPARTTVDTGVVVKPHILQRNKAKSVEVGVTQPEYTASIDTAFILGTNAGSFGKEDTYLTRYVAEVQTPYGKGLGFAHFEEQAKYDGEFRGTVLTVTAGNLNSANKYKYESTAVQSEYITLIQDFPSNICVISPSYSPVVVVGHNPRNLALDFTSLGITGVVFTSASIDITNQVTSFTFPTTNYTQHVVTASNPGLVECSGSITYQIEYCDLTPTGTAPYSITVGNTGSYNLTTWFNAGSNTNTSYTASWGASTVGITSPTNYVFTQPEGTVQIIQKDNIITGCSVSHTVNIIPATGYDCDYVETIYLPKILTNPEDPIEFNYIPCNNGLGGETVYESRLPLLNESGSGGGLLFVGCIISGSLVVPSHPDAYYDAVEPLYPCIV